MYARKDAEMLKIIVRGPPDSGKTTTASLIADSLKEMGYQDVIVADIPGLPTEQKDDFPVRLKRTHQRPVRIEVELER